MTSMNIPFVDLKKINSTYKKKFLHSLNSAIKNSNFIKGKKIQLLEKKLCEVFQCKNALTLNSGTDALIVAIKSLNLKKGDEVIISPIQIKPMLEIILHFKILSEGRSFIIS